MAFPIYDEEKRQRKPKEATMNRLSRDTGNIGYQT